MEFCCPPARTSQDHRTGLRPDPWQEPARCGPARSPAPFDTVNFRSTSRSTGRRFVVQCQRNRAQSGCQRQRVRRPRRQSGAQRHQVAAGGWTWARSRRSARLGAKSAFSRAPVHENQITGGRRLKPYLRVSATNKTQDQRSGVRIV